MDIQPKGACALRYFIVKKGEFYINRTIQTEKNSLSLSLKIDFEDCTVMSENYP